MLKIYDTIKQKKCVFTPINNNKVTLYVCGMTVYDYCHIGHARQMLAFDVIVRYLRYRGYHVEFVRNVTDIDDKIIRRANENGESIFDCAGYDLESGRTAGERVKSLFVT